MISGAERWCLGVLSRASLWAKLISDVSDSEKLLVLESEGVNFFTVWMMSMSLPKVDTTLIDGAWGSSFWVLSAFLFRHLSDCRAFLEMFSIKVVGYPAFLKHSPSSLRRLSRRS